MVVNVVHLPDGRTPLTDRVLTHPGAPATPIEEDHIGEQLLPVPDPAIWTRAQRLSSNASSGFPPRPPLRPATSPRHLRLRRSYAILWPRAGRPGIRLH